jgi:hypothetical protein
VAGKTQTSAHRAALTAICQLARAAFASFMHLQHPLSQIDRIGPAIDHLHPTKRGDNIAAMSAFKPYGNSL